MSGRRPEARAATKKKGCEMIQYAMSLSPCSAAHKKSSLYSCSIIAHVCVRFQTLKKQKGRRPEAARCAFIGSHHKSRLEFKVVQAPNTQKKEATRPKAGRCSPRIGILRAGLTAFERARKCALAARCFLAPFWGGARFPEHPTALS